MKIEVQELEDYEFTSLELSAIHRDRMICFKKAFKAIGERAKAEFDATCKLYGIEMEDYEEFEIIVKAGEVTSMIRRR